MSQSSDPSTAQVLSIGKAAHQIAGVEAALIQGDLSKLTEPQRIQYYLKMCETVGLNPTTKPFDYHTWNGKTILYASKSCAEQLRSIHKVSVTIKNRETIGDSYVVTASASLPDGRVDESLGAVAINGLKGDAFCNALMKAETKAKRRVTLSICGLGMLDETEVETIPGAQFAPQPAPKVAPSPAPAPKAVEVVEAKPEPVKAKAKADTTNYHMQLISGPFKGRLISDLTKEEAQTYFKEVNEQLEAINKPPSTLFGAYKEIYYTLAKYVEEGEKA